MKGDYQLPTILYFDGSIKGGNPGGSVTWGWYIEGGPSDYGYSFEDGPAATNNVAEYLGLIHGLIYLVAGGKPSDEILIRGDSQLVIRQMQGEWGVNAENMKPLNAIARRLTDDLQSNGYIVEYEWIPRKENIIADELSRGNEAKG